MMAVLLLTVVANIPRVIVPAAVQAAEPAGPASVHAAEPIVPVSAPSSNPILPVSAPAATTAQATGPSTQATTASTQAANSTVPMSVQVNEHTDVALAVEPNAAWVKTNRETPLWSGWDAQAKQFSMIPNDITLQVIEIRGSRAYVYFPGDRKGHPAGNVWVDRSSLTDLAWPRWIRARNATALRAEPSVTAETVKLLPRGSYVESTGVVRGRWSQAYYLAEGSPDAWSVGWVDALDFWTPRGNQSDITSYTLSNAQLTASQPDVWLRVPYRSQLDGADYEDSNCGPASVAMALDTFGMRASLADLRAATMKLQDTDGCDDCGSYIQTLASVTEARGLKTFSLLDNPDTLHQWTIDEVRQQLRNGRVVIPQVKFRQLPGRTTSAYSGDHFIVITGISGSNFLYNDPIDTDGRGYGRVISSEQLAKAMGGAHDEFAWSAFAVGR
jgi:hypothetical protein